MKYLNIIFILTILLISAYPTQIISADKTDNITVAENTTDILLKKQIELLQQQNAHLAAIATQQKDEERRRMYNEGYVSNGNGGYKRAPACFIATATYGSELDPKLDILRHFRDRELITNPIGNWFVETYYKTSPPIADFIRDKEWMRSAVRFILDPIVNALQEKYQ